MAKMSCSAGTETVDIRITRKEYAASGADSRRQVLAGGLSGVEAGLVRFA